MHTDENPILSTSNITISIKYALSTSHDNTWYEVKAKHEYALWVIQTGTLCITYHQKQYTLCAGDAFLFYPQVLYDATSATGCSFLFIHFDAILGHNCQALHFYPFDGPYHFDAFAQELTLLFTAFSSTQSKEPFCDLRLKGSLLLFLAKAMQFHYQEAVQQPASSHQSALARLQPVLIYINNHISEAIYMQDLADIMNLSEKYFITFFKKTMGLTPANYMIQIKMKKALEYLHEQNYSVKEVASLVGYSDIYTFSKVFKKTYGIPPSKI